VYLGAPYAFLMKFSYLSKKKNLMNLNPDFQSSVFSILLEIENFIFSCSFSFFLYPYQAGGELTDFIIVLRTTDAVKTFSGNIHLSVGAGLSAAVGIVGRAAEADVRAGDGGYAACYTYSCSKGA